MKLSEFKQDFSGSALKTIDGERRIVGKFCEITILDGIFDIWIVQPDREPISSQKLTWLIKGIEALPVFSSDRKATIQRLTGEAYLQTTNRDLVVKVGLLCRVRRRIRFSVATLQRKREHLARFRQEAAA